MNAPNQQSPSAATEADGPPEIDEGRYLYCLVRANEGPSVGESLESTGVDDEPVSVVVENGIGAVLHSCDGLYDSSDIAQIRRWLVRHQLVVDRAGEAFGTPIPFQFDTIIRGDDEAVRTWLDEESETLERALSELAGHWEYRVEVVETDPIDDNELLDRDDRLQELRDRIDDAGEGTAHLLETQFDRRLSELRAARRESLSDDVRERLTAEAREVHALERSPTASLSTELGDEADSDTDQNGGETLCRLTLLAHEDNEGAIGAILEEVASTDGLEVRFTGPWPPYTFAPELGDGESTGSSQS
ncbi:gas vesicle protein GvpL [Natrialba swarupiae]|uniref:gas vesicle protein GvpL n=1 Tax=Natrialba swarupiae TaxID=2448032 RepID=UPI00192E3748|nr:GvpL/GvpF family gas vesicle protein [Natrialba swarupiae]